MGDWNILVSGTGVHHNGIQKDADQAFKRLVQELESTGHKIRFAAFTMGTDGTQFIQELKEK